jgi:hypothetical protein
MCICDQESMSLKLSSSAILHKERVNKIFEKRSMWLLDRFFKLVITVHLPLHQGRTNRRRLQCVVAQTEQRLLSSTIV